MLHLYCTLTSGEQSHFTRSKLSLDAPPGLCEAADVSRFLQISKNKKEKRTCVESGVFVIIVIISFS